MKSCVPVFVNVTLWFVEVPFRTLPQSISFGVAVKPYSVMTPWVGNRNRSTAYPIPMPSRKQIKTMDTSLVFDVACHLLKLIEFLGSRRNGETSEVCFCSLSLTVSLRAHAVEIRNSFLGGV